MNQEQAWYMLRLAEDTTMGYGMGPQIQVFSEALMVDPLGPRLCPQSQEHPLITWRLILKFRPTIVFGLALMRHPLPLQIAGVVGFCSLIMVRRGPLRIQPQEL